MKTIEQLIFEKKFSGEDFDFDNYYDWAVENRREAYLLCFEVAKQLQAEQATLLEYVEQLKSDVSRIEKKYSDFVELVNEAVEKLSA